MIVPRCGTKRAPGGVRVMHDAPRETLEGWWTHEQGKRLRDVAGGARHRDSAGAESAGSADGDGVHLGWQDAAGAFTAVRTTVSRLTKREREETPASYRVPAFFLRVAQGRSNLLL